MANLTDIAREVGISTAAVSQALSGKGRISDDVRKRVFATARHLGYRSGRVRFPDDHPAAVMLLPRLAQVLELSHRRSSAYDDILGIGRSRGGETTGEHGDVIGTAFK